MGYLFGATAIATLAVFAPAVGGFVYWTGWELQGAWLAYDALMVGRFVTLAPRYRGGAWLRTFVHTAP